MPSKQLLVAAALLSAAPSPTLGFCFEHASRSLAPPFERSTAARRSARGGAAATIASPQRPRHSPLTRGVVLAAATTPPASGGGAADGAVAAAVLGAAELEELASRAAALEAMNERLVARVRELTIEKVRQTRARRLGRRTTPFVSS